MSRLTTAKRNEITTMLLSHAFDQRFKLLKAESESLFNRIAAASWHGHAGAAETIPAELLPSSTNIYVRDFGKSGHGFVLESNYPQRVTVDFDGYMSARKFRTIASTDEDQTLNTDINAFADRVEAACNERDKAKRDIQVVLSSVSTYKRLYEVWPELRPVVPDVESTAASNSTALAPVMDSLNKMLGLSGTSGNGETK